MMVTKFKSPIYGTNIWIVVSNSFYRAFDDIEDIIDKKIVEPEEVKSIKAYTYAYERPDGKYRMILFFKPNSDPGIIAHESKHVVNLIFSWHGVKLSITNDEHECYLLGHIVNRCHNAIKKYKKK